MRGLSSRAQVAELMLWPAIPATVIIVMPELPGFIGVEGFAATPALHGAGSDSGCPPCTQLDVFVVVSALLSRAPLALGLPRVGSAPCARVDDRGASVNVADAHVIRVRG
jgi:hypothetical protein